MQADHAQSRRRGTRARTRRRALAGLALLAVAVLVTACTSSGTGGASTDHAASATHGGVPGSASTAHSPDAPAVASTADTDAGHVITTPPVTAPPLVTTSDGSDGTSSDGSHAVTSETTTTASSSMTDPATQTTTSASTPPPDDGSATIAGTDALGNAVVWGATRVAAVAALQAAIGGSTGAAGAAQPGLTILIPATAPKGFGAALDAARSLAADAGAQVQPLTDADPRNDRAAIKALAASPPQRVIGFGPDFGPVDRFVARVATAATGVELPGGGQVMFPNRTLVALYGYPGSKALGALGQQDLDAAIVRAKRVASGYKKWVPGPIVPTFEIISTVATAGAGADGDYSAASTVARLRPWVEAASAAGMYVVLDLQPGRAHLLQQANLFVDLLRLPNVGLALDPEWKLRPGEKPLQQIGGVDAAEVNSVIDWLSRLTAANHLPQKVLVLHQFRLSMLRDEHQIRTDDDNVAVLIHMDGQGSPGGKEATWRAVVAAAPPGVVFGWKNFFVMDKPMVTPEHTMDRAPAPVMISYQ